MKPWQYLVPIMLVLAACQLSPLTQEQIAILERQAEEAALDAATAPTDQERLDAMERERELRQEIDRLKAQDLGQQSGYVWELLLASLGLGGLGAARTFGKSRASQELAEMRAKLEAFEKGFNQPLFPQVPPLNPPDSTDNKTS